MKHTELPWKVHPYEQNKGGYFQISNGAEWIAAPNTRANAEFIVRACNCHEELVNGLQALVNFIDNNVLVRNIEHDADLSKYIEQSTTLVIALQNAQQALANATK